MNSMMKQQVKKLVRGTLPLAFRKRLCLWINDQDRLTPPVRTWWIQELLKDYAARDPGSYHRFLWSHHLAYADTYDVAGRFGAGTMKESRRLFFGDLQAHLRAQGVNPGTDVRTVLEVGCSLGYQLRHLETDLFPGAAELTGIDIDGQAIARGTEYLQGIGSRVQLHWADMAGLSAILGDKTYDVVFCTGVLMYLDRPEALAVVRDMLSRCRRLLALSGPAWSEGDNRTLAHPVRRETDGSFIHNLDELVTASGGEVIGRRWEGARQVDGHTIYFVFARPRCRPA